MIEIKIGKLRKWVLLGAVIRCTVNTKTKGLSGDCAQFRGAKKNPLCFFWVGFRKSRDGLGKGLLFGLFRWRVVIERRKEMGSTHNSIVGRGPISVCCLLNAPPSISLLASRLSQFLLFVSRVMSGDNPE